MIFYSYARGNSEKPLTPVWDQSRCWFEMVLGEAGHLCRNSQQAVGDRKLKFRQENILGSFFVRDIALSHICHLIVSDNSLLKCYYCPAQCGSVG